MTTDATVYSDLEDARAELELWRSGQRRKFWPKHPDVPDAMGTAANLARAQTGDDEMLDSLLREAATTIKALVEGYGYAVAERDKARDTLNRVDALFTGSPDTPCRTSWRDGIECVEVPMDDLRLAFDGEAQS